MRTLTGRVAVVTGAAGGIGRALAHRLHAEGCRLALVDRDGAVVPLAAELGATAHVVDLRAPAALDALAAEVVAAHGAVHLLVANAGVTVHGVLADQSADDVDRVLDVDLRAVIHGVRAFAPALRAAGEGHVVLVSSMAAFLGVPFQSTYSAAKAGVRAFGEALRIELAPDRIGVSTVLPGTIATAFLRGAASHDPLTSARMAELMLAYGTSPERVADRVVHAVRRNRAEVRVGWDSHLAALARRLAPSLVHAALAWLFRRAVVDGRLRGLR